MEEWLDLADLVERVQDFIDIGMLSEAHELLDIYENVFEDHWEIYYLYSRVLSEQEKHQQSIPYLNRALELEPDNPDCLLGLLYAYGMMNQIKMGGTYLLKAEKLYPDNQQVIIALIWYYVEINESQRAADYFERIKSTGTDNPEAYRNGGCAYGRLGRFDEAEASFKTALRINPQYDEVRELLADQLIYTGKTPQAIEIYRNALKESPNNVYLMSRLIFCLSQNRQIDEAVAVANQSIQLYPNSPAGYVDLAYVYLNNDETEKALDVAEKAIDVAPIDSEAYRVKGIACSELGKESDAKQFFEQAISLEPQNSEILRDYYVHLRSCGNEGDMLNIINQVIETEYPYCTEEYWFLADYYREKKKNLKAFHYLNKAYKTMPAEKELIPPMIDILLDQGHTNFSQSFLLKYMKKSGWNEIMNQYSTHKKLKGKWSQEGLRLLRFMGQKPIDFRKWIFRLYLIKFLLVTSSIMILSLAIPVVVLFGLTGFLALSSLYSLFFGFFIFYRRKKERAIQKEALLNRPPISGSLL